MAVAKKQWTPMSERPGKPGLYLVRFERGFAKIRDLAFYTGEAWSLIDKRLAKYKMCGWWELPE